MFKGYMWLIILSIIAAPSLAEEIASVNEAVESNSSNDEKRLSVVVDMARVRAAPSTDAPVLWKVSKFHPITVIDEKDEWIKFSDYEGDTAWIYASLVGSQPSVVIKDGIVNVRQGAGTDFDIAFKAERGVNLKVLAQQGEWLQVQHEDGSQGWIHQTLVW